MRLPLARRSRTKRARHLAFVELARAVARDLLQRCRHRLLIKMTVGGRGPAAGDRPGAVVQEHARGIGIGRERARHRGGEQRGEPVDQQALVRELHGRREQVLPRQAAVFRVGEPHAGDHARHRDGGGAFDVAIIQHRGPREEVFRRCAAGERIVGGVERHRRAHAVVDHAGAAFAGAPQHHGAAGGGSAHPGLDHADGEGDRDRGIDRIAAGIEHACTDFRRAAVRGGDHATAGGDHRFADDLGAGEVVHGRCAGYCALSRAKRTMSAWVANQTLPRALACLISSSRTQIRER